MSNKSRFGFFSIKPSHTATITDFVRTKSITFLKQIIGARMEELTYKRKEYIPAKESEALPKTAIFLLILTCQKQN